MANWCINTICINGKDISKFTALVKKTERNSKSIGGIFALDEFLAEAGFTTAEIEAMERRNDSTMVNSRGTVISMDEIPGEEINLYAESAWSSCAAVFMYAAKKLGLDVDIQYEATEPDNGYYVLSNPESLKELNGMIAKTLVDDKAYLYIHQYSQEVIPEPVFPTPKELKAAKRNETLTPAVINFTGVDANKIWINESSDCWDFDEDDENIFNVQVSGIEDDIAKSEGIDLENDYPDGWVDAYAVVDKRKKTVTAIEATFVLNVPGDPNDEKTVYVELPDVNGKIAFNKLCEDYYFAQEVGEKQVVST